MVAEDGRFDAVALDVMSESDIKAYSAQHGQKVKKYAFVTMSSTSNDGIVNQRKIIRLLSEAPDLEELHITGDEYGRCLPNQLPTKLQKLKVITLASCKNNDPRMSSINPQIIPNWIMSCPLLEQFNIQYGCEDKPSEPSKSLITEAILLAQEQCAQINRPMVKMSLNWVIQVGESNYLKKFNDLGIALTALRLRVDNSYCYENNIYNSAKKSAFG